MINRTILVGRLVADPELRYSQTGIPVCRFRLAVNRLFANQNGEREADFINCVAWRKQAENLANYMRKGSLVGIDGRIQTRNYEGQDGKWVYVTEVVADTVQFLESKKKDDGQVGQAPGQNYQSPNQSDPFDSKPIDISTEDLPF